MEKLRPWANNLWYFVQGACVVVTIDVIMFRIRVREGLMQHSYNILGILLFGLLAFCRLRYTGMIFSPDGELHRMSRLFVVKLEECTAILNFKDMFVSIMSPMLEYTGRTPWTGKTPLRYNNPAQSSQYLRVPVETVSRRIVAPKYPRTW